MTKAFKGFAACAAMVPSLLCVGSGARADDVALATGTDGSGVKVEITSLKRTEGDTATLKFQIKNDSSRDFTPIIGNWRMIDLPQHRVFDAGLYSNSCSAAAGGKTSCYLVFAAPAPATKSLTLKIFEAQFDLISGIPLSE